MLQKTIEQLDFYLEQKSDKIRCKIENEIQKELEPWLTQRFYQQCSQPNMPQDQINDVKRKIDDARDQCKNNTSACFFLKLEYLFVLQQRISLTTDLVTLQTDAASFDDLNNIALKSLQDLSNQLNEHFASAPSAHRLLHNPTPVFPIIDCAENISNDLIEQWFHSATTFIDQFHQKEIELLTKNPSAFATYFVEMGGNSLQKKLEKIYAVIDTKDRQAILAINDVTKRDKDALDPIARILFLRILKTTADGWCLIALMNPSSLDSQENQRLQLASHRAFETLYRQAYSFVSAKVLPRG